MAYSRHSVLFFAVILGGTSLGQGCSVGQGQGEIEALVEGPDFCDFGEPPYELSPSFFSSEIIGDHVSLRIQRGSAIESTADGLMIQIADVDEIKQHRIGLPIPIRGDAEALVQVVFYLNETCPSGFPRQSERRRPVIFEASGGTITFDAIYAPDVDPDATLTEARLDGVVFVDPAEPDERSAVLDGWFSFFYQRGSPAQRFP